MKGIFLEAKDIEIGMKVSLHQESNRSNYYNNIINSNPDVDIDYLIIKSKHVNSNEVFYVDMVNTQGKNLGQPKSNGFIVAGYQGNYDVIPYVEPIRYNLDDMFSNLDKLAEKVSD